VVIPKVHHTTTAQSAGFQGLGGGALNKLFAKCINFALLATIIAEGLRIVYINGVASKEPPKTVLSLMLRFL